MRLRRAGAIALLVATGCANSAAVTERVPVQSVDSADGTSMVPLEDSLAPFTIALDGVGISEVEVVDLRRQPDSPAPRAESSQPCREFLLDGPTFESNSAELTEAGRAVVVQLVVEVTGQRCGQDSASVACDAKLLEVELRGHTDDLPTSRPGGNQQLSEDRAAAVAEELAKGGLSIRSVAGYADTLPLVDDGRASDELRAANRRTEILLWCAR